MDFYIFDHDETFLYIRNDAKEAYYQEDEYMLHMVLPVDVEKPIENGQLIGFYDLDNDFQLFEIRQPEFVEPDQTIIIEAEFAARSELLDEIVEDVRPTAVQADAAVTASLGGTDWQLGVGCSTDFLSTNFYYLDAWNCGIKIENVWGVHLKYRWTISTTGINGRFVDVLPRQGSARGKRFELDKDIDGISIKYDDRNVYTALYGRGKGEEVGSAGDGDATYGRRLTFEDVVWTTPGNPVDKPAGQGWIEDPAATLIWGRRGRKRVGIVEFNDCTVASDLISLTWNRLQEVKNPRITITAKVKDMESLWGYQYEAVRLGDDVAVIVPTLQNLEIYASILKLKRDLLLPEQTEIIIGNYRKDIIDIQVATEEALKRAEKNAQVSAAIALANPGFLQQTIDTMVTKILSSGANRYTDADGCDVLETDDGQWATKIGGAGVLLARGKVGGVWDWRTAITGDGIAAEEINVGTLKAGIIFAGTLSAVMGTFIDLIAGKKDPITGLFDKQRIHMGADEYGDPFIKVYDVGGLTPTFTIHQRGITFPNGADFQQYTYGTRTGIGIFAV